MNTEQTQNEDQETQLTDEQIADQEAQELDILKSRARLMGITFSNNIGVEKLREKIQNKQDGIDESKSSEPEEKVNALTGKPVSAAQARNNLRRELQKEQMKLVRIRITNLDPKKKDLQGEIITVANDILGTVRKFVPYGEVTDDGYHVPYIIYKFLDKRKFLNIRTIKDRRTGNIRVEQQWVKEFSIEILPQLTEKQIKQLATNQAAAGSVD